MLIRYSIGGFRDSMEFVQVHNNFIQYHQNWHALS